MEYSKYKKILLMINVFYTFIINDIQKNEIIAIGDNKYL